jgi:hypothetical protein
VAPKDQRSVALTVHEPSNPLSKEGFFTAFVGVGAQLEADSETALEGERGAVLEVSTEVVGAVDEVSISTLEDTTGVLEGDALMDGEAEDELATALERKLLMTLEEVASEEMLVTVLEDKEAVIEKLDDDCLLELEEAIEEDDGLPLQLPKPTWQPFPQ